MALSKDEQAVLDNLLLEAVKNGDLEHVRLYADKGANVNATFDVYDAGWRSRPLFHHMDASNYPFDVADELIARGVGVDTRDYNGETMLARSVRAGDLERVTHLVAHGANPLAKNNNGMIVLDAARQRSSSDYARQEIIDTLVGALETTGGPRAANDAGAAQESAAEAAPANPVEASHDIKTLKPLELTRRKKNGGGLHL